MVKKGNLEKIKLETTGIITSDNFSDFIALPRHRIVSELIAKHSEKNTAILDVGCGNSCDQLRYLKHLGYTNISGLDFNIDRFFDGITLIEADLEHGLHLENVYDIVIFADVLEHLRYPRFVIKEILPYVKDDGLIIISVPNAGHFYNGLLLTFLPRHLNMSSAFGPWGHYYQFTFYGLQKLFKLFDLAIVEYKTSDKEFRFLSMHPLKRIAMWLLNAIPIALNVGFMRKYFSDHLYFVVKKQNDTYKHISDKDIFEANI